TPGVHAAADVRGPHFLLADETPQHDARRILPRDNPAVKLPVLRLDVPGVERRIDLAVGIDDGGEQFARAVRPHAGQRRPDLLPDVAEFVTGRAGGREQQLAGLDVAGFGNFRAELRDDPALLLRLRV